jgi:signal transduction histidine kinase/class 3 adenylate cyclase/ActR/RegA family two-component response regulator
MSAIKEFLMSLRQFFKQYSILPLCMIGFLSCTFPVVADDNDKAVVVLLDGIDELTIHYPYLEYFEDTKGTLEIVDIISEEWVNEFVMVEKDAPPIQSKQASYWYRFSIVSSSQTERILSNTMPVSLIELYLVERNGSVISKRSGTKLRQIQWDMPTKMHAFQLESSLRGEVTCYIRIYNPDHLIGPNLVVWSERAFYRRIDLLNIVEGALLGVFVAVFLFNVFLFFSLKDVSFLYVSLTVLFTLLDALVWNRMFPIFWTNMDAIIWVKLVRVLGLISFIFTVLFSRSFLRAKSRFPRISRIFHILFIAGILLVVKNCITLFPMWPWNLYPMLVIAYYMPIAVVSLRRGFRPARFYVIAFVSYIVGAVMFNVWNMDLIKLPYVLGYYALQIGGCVSMLLFTFALADRYKLFREEKEKAQRESIEQQALTNLRLEKLDKIKDTFLANTSHELRTPLNGIIGISESLIDGAVGKLSPPAKHNLSMIVSSGKRLASLVNDILDFSKLREGDIGIVKRPIDIKSMTDIVLALYSPMLAGKDVVIRNRLPEEFPLALGDENRVQQILHNLVGNAIKFTESGEISISGKEIVDSLEITVSDTGIGIPKDKQGDIFKSFEQADSSVAREYEGTGLGLSITKQLVELHDGTISVESVEEEGSAFSFTLPISTVEGVDTGKAGTPISSISFDPDIESFLPQSSAKRAGDFKILLVDDEPINLQVLSNQLSLQRFSLTQASNGEDALRKIEESNPDLVLLDIMMPKMSGYEVCQRIREDHPATELPVILLTAKNQVTDLVDGFQSGANDYITKPFSKNELLARINTHLGLTQIHKSYTRFVPFEFLNLLEKDSILDVRFGDQVQKVMTVMFADIRSFTELSELMTPEENFAFINSYLERVGPAIRACDGFVDKYIGDGIMALFPHKAEDAIAASIDMQKRISEYNEYRRDKQLVPIQVGIGMHTGSLILGTIGERERMDETVISDAVNLASRIEGLTKLYETPILVSEETLGYMENREQYVSRHLGKVQVKGKLEAVSVLEVMDGTLDSVMERKIETKEEFERGLEMYFSRDFAEASVCFNNLLKKNPDDKAAQIYRERSAQFIVKPPPAEWDGVEIVGHK